MYKCRTCNGNVADTAIRCPHCGDIDPFFDKECEELHKKWSKKLRRSENKAQIITLFFAIGIPGFIAISNISNLEGWHFLLLIFLGTVIFFIVGWIVGNKYEKEDKNEYDKMRNAENKKDELKV